MTGGAKVKLNLGAMQRWEYSFYLPRKDEKGCVYWDTDEMNELGKVGWEAIGPIGDTTSSVGLLMKRPAADSPAPPGPPKSA